jgi:2-C-methyl-D-erythritol 4-phosphate cytidylyltransferase
MESNMDKKIYAVFVAGGSGVRMGSATPKQFLDLAGKPVLLRTVERFVEAIENINIIVVLPKAHFETWRKICLAADFHYPQILVGGGITRFHSVQNALERVPDGAAVLIHDGVRPMSSPYLINRCAELASEGKCVIPVTAVTDTLKSLVPSEVEGEWKESGLPAPDRGTLFGAQTPQAFPSEVLKRAYRCAYQVSFTDDASVASYNKIPLTYIQGERYNIKITTPEDLEFLRKVY